MLDFVIGFLFAWVLLGAFALGGLARDWYFHDWFWIALALPVIPLVWVICWLLDRLR